MSSLIRFLPAIALLAAVPAGATTHRHHEAASHRHPAASHRETAHRHAATARHATHKSATRADKAASRHAAASGGAVTVPAGGLKLFCAAHSPLLVRKFSQGSGTTVTVLCR